MNSLLQAENLSKRYGEKLLFEGIDIHISEGDKTALVARNGAGKTSLLNILGGRDTGDTGTITVKRDLRMSYLPQDIDLPPQLTVLQAVLSHDDAMTTLLRDYNACLLLNDHNRLQPLIDKMDSCNAWNHEAKVKQILSRLKINNVDMQIGQLSGGQKKRVALAATLIGEPELIILDEPTNHIDLDMIEWLEDFLKTANQAIFMVTHDRYFLDRICNNIIELDDGRLYSYNGNYTYFVEKRAARLDNLKANVERARNLMRSEQEWMRRMPKARSHKAKFRINEFDNIKAKANVKIDNTKLSLDIAAERLGKKVINIYNISKSFGGVCLFNDFSYKAAKNEKIGIVGDNGTGKTSFLNIIMGRLQPDSGHVDIGTTVKPAYYRQEGISFDDDTKPIDIIKNIAETVKLKNGKTFSASGFLQYFLFSPEMQHTLVRKLSGGEKRRLYLCSILMQQPNVLILDEPTNDLDIITLQVLEEYLCNIEACVFIVSHDRFFMDKIVDHIFVFDGKGKITDFPGNYTQYRNSILGQKGNKPPAPTASKTNKQPYKNRQPATANKMSFKEKQELSQLEQDIERLEAQKQELEQLLSSNTLSINELNDKSKLYAAVISELDSKELRWLALSERLE